LSKKKADSEIDYKIKGGKVNKKSKNRKGIDADEEEGEEEDDDDEEDEDEYEQTVVYREKSSTVNPMAALQAKAGKQAKPAPKGKKGKK